jgi:hypothetical protein
MFTYLPLAAIALQQDDGAGAIAALFSGFGLICWFAFIIVLIAGLWKVYVKAGKPGWASIIPFYNIWVMLEIVGRPGWWLILFFIPFVNFVISIIIAIDLAKSFGKDALYGIILLWFFNIIGFLMLGFGDAQYEGPSAAQQHPVQ